MTDQDPPIEPLRRMDPTEPDEQGLGHLERLDPEAEDSVRAGPAGAAPGAPPKASRLRDGVTAAVTLAALLSLSSIAAIGGLVAVSMRSVAPAGIESVAPVDAGAPLTTIRVGESAQGAPEEPDRDRPNVRPQDDDSVVEFTPVLPPPDNEGGGTGGGNGGGDGNEGGAGSAGGDKGSGGAWCDARVGAACDAGTGGAVLGPATEVEGEGYVGGEDDEPEYDEDDANDEDSSGGTSSGSHHSKGN